MNRINQNQLAWDVTCLEGKKKAQDIAQVKETIGITLDMLAKHNIFSIWLLMRDRRRKKKTNW